MPRYTGPPPLRETDYAQLANFRHHIRAFLRFSETAAREAGVEAQQYQLLLALKGLPSDVKPTIRELATRLTIEHHSAVGLVDRLEKKRLVERTPDREDHRQTIIRLTQRGERTINKLAAVHADELRSRAPELIAALSEIIGAASEAA